MNDGVRLSSAFLLSLLLHAALVGLLGSLSALRLTSPATPPPLDIDVVSLPRPPKPPAPPPERVVQKAPPPQAIAEPAAEPAPEPVAEPVKEPPPRNLPLPEQQIVSPSEGGEEKPPEDTRFVSDRDATVKEQSIRRGEPAPGEPVAESARKAEKTGKNAREARRSSDGQPDRPPTELAARPRFPGIDELLPGASRMASEGYGRAESESSSTEEKAREQPDLLKQGGGGWQVTSNRPGALDFLPDVREGDITLLNTKAELFSPFVRRVAVRVFGHLVILLRRQLEGVSTSTQEWVSLEAIMDKHGDLVALQAKDRSPASSLSLDRSLQRACHDGFFDRNPPRGAEATDGRIHFLLQIHVATVAGPDGRSLGYRALFSAGLL